MWRRLRGPGLERCTLRESDTGARLDGTVLTILDGRATEVRYSVRTDERWVTREVIVALDDGTERRRCDLAHDGQGGWTTGEGRPIAAVQGCLDVDLEVSPSTNTLPIRRLGGSAEVEAAWVRFPSLAVERLTQRYERLGDRRWRYSSDGFKAMLELSPESLVLRYQRGWEAVTGSSPG